MVDITMLPHRTLTKIQGKPNQRSLKVLMQQLMENAFSVKTDLGGGQHGHCGIILSATEYTELTKDENNPNDPGQTFVFPKQPLKPTVTISTTTEQRYAEHEDYKEKKEEWKTANDFEEISKKMITDAVDKIYLAAIYHKKFGFAHTKSRQILEHLWKKYNDTTDADIEQNKIDLAAAFDPSQPMEILWNRADTCMTFAEDAKEPLTEAEVCRILAKVLHATQVFDLGCLSWNNRDNNQKDYAKFQEHFNKYARSLPMTTGEAGYANFAGLRLNNNQADTTTTPHAAAATINETLGNYDVISRDGTQAYYYCWSHGLGRNKNHTSATCNARKEGHQADATLNDPKGGCPNLMGISRRNQWNSRRTDE